jgi:methylene-tetrahydromethanopterin dehydrogenase
MEKRSIIHMLDPMPHNSPFDINMAVDAGFDVVATHSNVKLEQVTGLVQDAIFSRGPAGVKRTGIFIGGRDIGLAMAMLEAARKAMVPPFEVSVFADPSGAFTTAAALVACVERELKIKHNLALQGRRTIVFGGTGPVGIAAGVIASLNGADTTIVDHLSIDTALEKANDYNRLCGSALKGTYASSDADKARLITNAETVFCAARAGVQVLSASVLEDAKQIKVAGDVNAVPPLGIEGVKVKDSGAPLLLATQSPGAVGIGALAIGNVKYKLQHKLLSLMLETDKPVYLDFRTAFQRARELV